MIYHGNALDYLRNQQDGSVDCILTDPPYDFSEEAKNQYHSEFLRVSKGWVIVFSPPENLWQPSCEQWLFWIKPISTKNTSKRYSRFVEIIQVFRNGYWNNNRHWSQYTNVFTDLVEGHTIHPYEKPESLINRLIANHTLECHTILDPFCGSGTIPTCAKKLGRTGIGVEQNRDYASFAYERHKQWEC